MNCRIGYLEESGYLTEGNVIRHGDVLRDMIVEDSVKNRTLGMIGALDIEVDQTELLSGDAALAHFVIIINGNVRMIPMYYSAPMVRISGLDPEAIGIKQVIRVEMFGYESISIVTVTDHAGVE